MTVPTIVTQKHSLHKKQVFIMAPEMCSKCRSFVLENWAAAAYLLLF